MKHGLHVNMDASEDHIRHCEPSEIFCSRRDKGVAHILLLPFCDVQDSTLVLLDRRKKEKRSYIGLTSIFEVHTDVYTSMTFLCFKIKC